MSHVAHRTLHMLGCAENSLCVSAPQEHGGMTGQKGAQRASANEIRTDSLPTECFATLRDDELDRMLSDMVQRCTVLDDATLLSQETNVRCPSLKQ